ncbi:ABC transporter ATP-binding protein [Bacteriovorax sp. DB6_IX]|uniref:ABC transporter ATP-binding protein n=1 Tax=Bacteriovorax sp. DB6_IX TaxID=1353530 RepID=UPI00038A13C9|nr:ABC transporter ATP-binding protein [Bacteriovorax sp. DB6_IX]EQC51375.1 ABC transporter, ATP-binding protein [Bacteriovorax sp. DB6_IX]
MILNVENLTKQYLQGGTIVKALDDISFNISTGESLSIVGPSGSGKTTLLTLLAGLDKPSEGKIILNKEDLTKLSEKEIIQFRSQNIGIVFQQFHLMPHLTALENVSLPLEIAGKYSLSEIEERAKHYLDLVGLSHRHDHFPNQLSGGECQRVAIARATIMNPKILLADEPSGNLDTKTGIKVMDLLFKMSEDNQSNLILVTHDIRLANRCQRQIHLTGGRLQ